MVIYNNIKIIVVIKEMHIYLKRIINALEVDIDIQSTGVSSSFQVHPQAHQSC